MMLMNTLVGLECRGIHLRPPRQEDMQDLYRLRSDKNQLYLWSRRDLVSYDDFLNEVEADVHAGCVWVVETRGKVVGLVYLYDIVDRHACLTIAIRPDRRGIGIGAVAGALALRYGFTDLALEKIYFRVFEYNNMSLPLLRHTGFRLEGTFPLDREWNGQLWTTYVFACYRSDLPRIETLLAHLAQRGRVGAPTNGEDSNQPVPTPNEESKTHSASGAHLTASIGSTTANGGVKTAEEG